MRLFVFGLGYAARAARGAGGRRCGDDARRARGHDARSTIARGACTSWRWRRMCCRRCRPAARAIRCSRRYGDALARQRGVARLSVLDRGLWRHRRRLGRRERADRRAARRARAEADAAWLALGARVFRLPGIYGPGRSRARPGARGRRRTASTLPGQVFSRVHVDDIARGRDRRASRRRRARTISPTIVPAPQNEVIEFAAALLGLPPPPLRGARGAVRRRRAAFYAENRRVANGKAKRVLGWRPRYPDYRAGPARAQRDDQPDAGQQPRPRRGERRPAIALEQRRQQHRDHRHDHADIGRLGRADRADARRNRAGRRAPRRTRRDRAMPSEIARSAIRTPAARRSPGERRVDRRADQHRHRRASAPSDSASAVSRRLHDVGDRGGEDRRSSVSAMPDQRRAGAVRIAARLVDEQQRDARHRDGRARRRAAAPAAGRGRCAPSSALGTSSSAKTTATRPEVMYCFGAVDEVEVEARTARRPSTRRERPAARVEPERLALRTLPRRPSRRRRPGSGSVTDQLGGTDARAGRGSRARSIPRSA